MIQQGRILRYQSGFYTVDHDGKIVTCKARGRLKLQTPDSIQTDLIAIGDQVEFSLLPDGSGIIENVLPRKNQLIRMVSGVKYEYRQILISNLDQIFLVFAAAFPAPKLGMLDRFLVICEKQEIHPVILVNKIDLVDEAETKAIFKIYSEIGYEVLYTSATNRRGIKELQEKLTGRVSGFVGPSGVGKSSLINLIDPTLDLKVADVSEYTSKGRHTTVVREMFPLVCGGYLADLPGLKTLALWDIEPEELDGYFPEIRPLVAKCTFSDCTHNENEVGCAIHQAVIDGKVSQERYQSYLRIRFGLSENNPSF